MIMILSVLLVMMSLPTLGAVFTGQHYVGDQVFRVVPKTDNQVAAILNVRKTRGLQKMDAWMPTFSANHPADFYVTKNENAIFKRFLNRHNISFHYLVSNVTAAILNQRPREQRRASRQKIRKRNYNYRQYNPLNEIHEELKNLARKYPDKTKLLNLGLSYENRTMWAIQILSKNKRKNRKMIFIDCGTHAREWISPATCMWFIREIIKSHKKSHKMCQKIDWVILPVLNVDGYVYTWTEEGRFWRKNRKPNNGSECKGTDLNRNWGYKWGGNASSDPCASYYRGSAPFSEIEVRNVAKFLYRNRCNLLGYIALHSYSQFWMTPWGYKKERPEHYTEMKRVADIAVQAIKDSGQGAYYDEPGPSSEVIYRNYGSTKDWTYAYLGVQYSYGVELRPHFNGNYGFLVPPDQIEPSGKEILAALTSISQEVVLHPGRRLLNQAHHNDHEGHNSH